MILQIYPASPKALEFCNNVQALPPDYGATVTSKASKYPFDVMQIGHCFIVGMDAGKPGALRKAVSLANKTHEGKQFKLLRHVEYNCWEVARIA